MDELCLHWSQVAERRGGGVLRHPGMDSASCAIVLAATADGNLLPPFLVIKVRCHSSTAAAVWLFGSFEPFSWYLFESQTLIADCH